MPANYITTLGSEVQMEGLFGEAAKEDPFGLPRLAMLGRSNVGKSSLINALTRSKVAQTSKRPGSTRKVNLYEWQGHGGIIADLPGYGYATGSKASVNELYDLIRAYVTKDKLLLAVVLLLDARHGPTANDEETIQFFLEENIPFTCVFTKNDQLKKQKDRAARKKAVTTALKPYHIAFEDTTWVSVNEAKSIQSLAGDLRALFREGEA